MPRKARVKEEQAYYHIYNRGDNKEDMFIDDQDKIVFIDRLKRYITKYDFILLAYCLMTNHFHLLIHSNGADISNMMKGLTLSYGHYFRKKYNKCGHLVQNRFKSELLTSSTSVIIESMYIHCNPINAGLVEHPEDYPWSSMSYYIGGSDANKIIDNSRVMAMLGRKRKNCIDSYVESINQYIKDKGYDSKVNTTYEIDDYDYENIEKRTAKRDHNPSKVIELVSHRNNARNYEILHKFTRKYKDAKQICIFMLCLHCNMSYTDVGKLFELSPSAVGYNVRGFLITLKDNETLDKEVKYYSNLIA